MTKRFPLLLLSLPLLLAACGGGTPSPEADAQMVKLHLTASLSVQNRSALKAQGVPSGGTPVTYVKVRVYDAKGSLMHFDGHNVYQQNGTQDALTLTAEQPTATALLPRGTYTFENIGKANDGGTFLAYGKNVNEDLQVQNPAVKLALHTLAHPDVAVDGSDGRFFSPALPTQYVTTGDVLELRTLVPAAGTGNTIPTGDYESTVTVDAALGSVLGQSKLGARVSVTGTTDAAEFVARNTLKVWVATGTETAEQQTFVKTLRLPLSKTGIGADITAPTVNGLAVYTDQWGGSKMLVGTAFDDQALARVQVYDGVRLIGSTDQADVDAGAARIGFGETGTNAWTLYGLPLDIVGHSLTVIAADTSGNEQRVTHEAENDPTPTLRFPYRGWGSNQSFNVATGVTQWYRLDLRTGLAPYTTDVHNDWDSGWGNWMCVFTASFHDEIDGPALSTNTDTCNTWNGWSSTSKGFPAGDKGLYYLRIQGQQDGRGNIDFF